MKRTYHFVTPKEFVACRLPSGEELSIPVVQGLLKHLAPQQLRFLLQDLDVLRKYTVEALRRAPWSVVKTFPRSWLYVCMENSDLPEGRLQALRFMLE